MNKFVPCFLYVSYMQLLIGLVSDCYLGLDQFASLPLQQGSVARGAYKVIEPSSHAQ